MRQLLAEGLLLGVAGAAHGSFDLVVIGLLISIPIVVFGSTVVLKLVERFPVIIQIGSAVLAFTAAKMIVSEPLLDPIFGGPDSQSSQKTLQTLAEYGVYVLAVAGVWGAGVWASKRDKTDQSLGQ